ncbi:MAG: RnfABCDGE type electron transport complex subunit B [Betaproteobacteria bacterium]|nr:RnfABCDGE type electron transport complex subunit B [Betaproteobacteria bacterium]
MKRDTVAVVDESRCIGCTLCLDACPVDAIVGANRYLHTVVEPWCTGCKLCLPPCPADCIEMLPLPAEKRIWTAKDAAQARERGRKRQARLAHRRRADFGPAYDRRALVDAALKRAQAKRATRAR